MERFKAFWSTLPTPSKAIALGVVVGVGLLLIGGTQQITSYVKDKSFAREVGSYKKKIEEKTAEGDASEARARAAEGQLAKQELVIEIAGKEAVKAAKKVEDAETKFNQETEQIDAPATDCERYAALRRSLNLKPVECKQVVAPQD